MKKFLLFISSLSSVLILNAQVNFGPPSAAVYGGAVTAKAQDWQAIDVNPANLGWKDNHKFSLIICNVSLSLQSHALNFGRLSSNLHHLSDSLTQANKQTVEQYVTGQNGLYAFGYFNWLSASMYFPKVGGFAFGVSDVIAGHAELTPGGADLLSNAILSNPYKDTNILRERLSQGFAGSSFGYTHYREFNFDYGRLLHVFKSNYHTQFSSGNDSINRHPPFELYGGIGLKYLLGLADFYANATQTDITSYSAWYTNGNPFFSAPGHGFGGDIGLSGIYGKWKFGLSVVDIGFISWTKNLKQLDNSYFPKLDSNSYGLEELTKLKINYSNYQPLITGPAFKTDLPTRLQTGASYNVNKHILLSTDIVFPLNNVTGSLRSPYYSIAGQFTLSKFIGSIGLTYDPDYGLIIPFGIVLGPTDIYLGTNDLFSFLGLTNSPNLSIVVGIFRLNF